MLESLNIFLSSNFIPHGHCYLWKPGLVWLHVGSDLLTALAYYSIPLLLFYFVSKRRDVPFDWIFVLFGTFIISCGTTHLFEVWTLWHPQYWLSGFVKAFTGLISIYTAIELIPLIPQALALPSPAQLEAANLALALEIGERKQIEQELRLYKDNLEELVEQRTAELAHANDLLQLEVAQRKKSEAKLARLLKEVESVNNELRDFAYVVSHDLKAPLRAISSLADFVLTDYSHTLDEDGQEMIRLMTNKVYLLQRLIDGILQYSRVGRLKEEKVIIGLNQLVSEVIFLLSPPKNIEIKLVSDLPEIKAEKNQIQQLFQNLISNGIKFIDKPEGKIEIGCERQGNNIVFRVSDNGMGIESQFFHKIFQMFQKLSSEKSDSTGIGLALVKKIVETYDGKIWLESELGKGTTFFFTLPKALSA